MCVGVDFAVCLMCVGGFVFPLYFARKWMCERCYVVCCWRVQRTSPAGVACVCARVCAANSHTCTYIHTRTQTHLAYCLFIVAALAYCSHKNTHTHTHSHTPPLTISAIVCCLAGMCVRATLQTIKSAPSAPCTSRWRWKRIACYTL